MNIEELHRNASRAADLLRTMGNERRLMILCELGRGELSVSQMEPLIGLSQSALSQHLAVLRQQGLVTTRRDSQTIYYSLSGDEAQRIIETLYGLYCSNATDGAADGDGTEPEPPPQFITATTR
ncbi:MAG: metalloregulator ArsR/SmtB family transcription factor [Rhodospirillales bacterium]|nr:metalloregulator ArsR/SmtB family transcription factor [Rhodospirillales bacterium]